MCGIFGGIGRVDNGTIRALAIANRARGKESLGFFDSSGRVAKSAGDPLDVLATAEVASFLNRSCAKSWFVAGHTRLATRGDITRKNAHPFRFGNVVGAHNGMVDAPSRYAVDSMFLFDRLATRPTIQDALGDVSGYWGLSWFDGAAFYLQAHDNEIYLAKAKGAYYFSSDGDHLLAALGARKLTRLHNGATLRWRAGEAEPQRLAEFISKSPVFYGERWRTTGAAKPSGKAKAKPSGKAKGATVAAKLPATAKPSPRDWELLAPEEYDYCDALAVQQGHASFDDFMHFMGLVNEVDGYDALLDCAASSKCARKEDSFWGEGDDYKTN